MLYLVYVLTFLAGILFYALTPRDDQARLDQFRAEGFISSFLAQHQAAKDYISTWLGLDKSTKTSSASFDLNADFMSFFPRAMSSESCTDIGVSNWPGSEECFLSRIYCLNSAETSVTTCSDADIKNTYIVTYGGWGGDSTTHTYTSPSWWPNPRTNRYSRNDSWRRAVAHRTHGSYNCGMLKYIDCGSGNMWCIDNGQTLCKGNKCAKQVPTAIVRELGYGDISSSPPDLLGLDDLLICVSGIRQGPSQYVHGLTYFFDGLDNQSVGAQTRNVSNAPGNWVDAVSNSLIQGDFSLSSVAASAVGGTLNIPNIKLKGKGSGYHLQDFTLIILTKGSFDLTFMNDNIGQNNLELISTVSNSSVDTEKLEVKARDTARTCTAEVTYTGLKTADQIVYWTIISSGDRVSIYQNLNSNPLVEVLVSGLAWPTDTQGLKISSGNAFIYGIRYYDGKVLTEKELRQNFRIDSKRYGIPNTQLSTGNGQVCNPTV